MAIRILARRIGRSEGEVGEAMFKIPPPTSDELARASGATLTDQDEIGFLLSWPYSSGNKKILKRAIEVAAQ
jgi:hypothetical protein